MKILKLFTVIWILSAGLSYLIGAYTTWNYNPSSWDTWGRVLSLFLWIIVSCIAIAFGRAYFPDAFKIKSEDKEKNSTR